MKKLDTISAFIAVTALALDGFIWIQIARGSREPHQIQFLDVGQGDSTLLTLADGVQILTDAGPDGAVMRALAAALTPADRYIDLAVITHPERDHYGGLSHILERYRIGAILWNGLIELPRPSPEWDALLARIREADIPMIPVQQGDRISIGESAIAILSPDPLLLGGAALNDGAIVQRAETPDFSALLTADIGVSVEQYLLRAASSSLRADILKIAHHGSKYSSDERFLQAVDPSVAVVQAGAENRYGHPAPEALARIQAATVAELFRNDEQGTITVRRGPEGLIVHTESASGEAGR